MPIVKFVAPNGFLYPIEIDSYTDDSYYLKFSYTSYMALQDEIKNLENARWLPEKKVWTIKKSERNKFALEYLCGKSPFKRWLDPLQHYDVTRQECMTHQRHMVDVILSRRQIIIAGEAGVGKTLALIEAIEQSGCNDVLWAAPNSALYAVQAEFDKWKSKFWPEMITYDSLKKLVAQWPKGKKAPQIFVCDEAHRLKNETTQRYQAAKYIVKNMYEDWDDHYIVLLSGTPVPNDPSEWWSLTELIRPGWLRESSPQKLKKRLAFIKDEESLVGGWYPKLVTWWDDERKCKICGMYKDDLIHTLDSDHDWQPSTNEVAKLYNRLKGIVDITFKKDVLKELPEKNHRIIRCQPSEEILRAAKLIVANARNAVTAAVLLRELSDGFQYKDKVIGEKECDICKGRKIVLAPKSLSFENCPICDGEIQDNICIGCSTHFDVEEGKEEVDCYNCGGEGITPIYEREAVQVPCPKEDVLKNVLDEYEDTRRAVIYAGFTGSVDRCVDVCKSVGWEIIRVDGRGWVSSIPSLSSPAKMLQAFQEKNTAKLAFIAQPDSGGIGITLTASCFEFFYSNSFNAASKSQAMDRIHRPGMNINKGATIIECFHLPSDEKCYEALKKKKRLQDLTLGVFQEALK